MKKRYLLAFILLAAFISLSVEQLWAQSLIRGPYLQSSGPNSIIVCWRTDIPSASRAYYGETLNPTVNYADGDSVSTEHRVKITGLSPRTKYYYTIGSSTQTLRGDSLMYFTTAPDPANPTPVRIWAMGDFGHGNDGARLVKESYLDFAATHGPADFWLWLGDNVYDDGTDNEYQTKVFSGPNGYSDIFPNLPFFSTSGNHDYNSICPWQDPNGFPVLCNQHPDNHTGPYLDLIEPPSQGELGGVPSNRKIFYSFDYGDIHFVCLNSELGSFNAAYNWLGVLDTTTGFTSPMLEWLKTDLAATTKKWKIVFWHQCPYSGQDNLTEASSFQIFCIASREHFNPIVEQYGVDLVLTGHDHNYQRSYLINGHYGYKASFTSDMMIDSSSGNDAAGEAYVKYTDGPDEGVGTVYVVQGGCSNVNSYSPIEHPAIYWGQACDTCLGSFIVDVDGDRLDGRYITAYGETLDQFTILKQSSTGIKEESSVLDKVSLHPNPSNGQVSLCFTLLKKSEVKIAVMDLNKKEIFSVNPGIYQPGNHNETLDLEKAGLINGTYIVRLECGSSVKFLKVVKLN